MFVYLYKNIKTKLEIGHLNSTAHLLVFVAKEEGYFEEHPFMFISTPEKDYRLDLIAGFVTEPTSFAYIRNFDSDVQFLGYIENIKSLSDFDSDVEVEAEDHVVSLSTCTYEVDDGRYVIVGKLVELT